MSVQRMFILAININFFMNRKSNTAIDFTSLSSLFPAARLLIGELVPWETENNKVLIFILLIQLFKSGKLSAQTVLCWRINDDYYIIFVLLKLISAVILIFNFYIINTVH